MTDAEIIDLFFERSEQAITELAKKTRRSGQPDRIQYPRKYAGYGRVCQ